MDDNLRKRAEQILNEAHQHDSTFPVNEEAIKNLMEALTRFDTEKENYKPSLLTKVFGSIFGLLMASIFWCFYYWWWRNAHATDLGIDVSSKVRGSIARYSWSEIAAMRRVGYGPGMCPELVLTNGKTVMLHLADWDELASVVSARGIQTYPNGNKY